MKKKFTASHLMSILFIGIVTVIFSVSFFPEHIRQDIFESLFTSTLDQDEDGMRDSFEEKYTDPASPTALGPYDDEDGDGFENLYECRNGTNPTVWDYDSDSDGMPDDFELKYSSSATALNATEDIDYDFVSNLQEYYFGSDPTSGDDSIAEDECDLLS